MKGDEEMWREKLTGYGVVTQSFGEYAHVAYIKSFAYEEFIVFFMASAAILDRVKEEYASAGWHILEESHSRLVVKKNGKKELVTTSSLDDGATAISFNSL